MKKILIGLLFSFLITGCGSQKSLNFNKIEADINNIEVKEFDLDNVISKIEAENLGYFENLKTVYPSELDNYNINSTYIVDILFRINSDDTPAYIIVEPTKNNGNNLKKEIETYLNINNYNYELKKLNNYYVYLFNKEDNKNIFEIIKSCQKKLMPSLYNIDNDNFENMLGFESNNIKDYLIKISVESKIDRYFIIKPLNGKKNTIKKQMKDYFEKLKSEWSTKEEQQLIENMLIKDYNGYLIYIISHNNEAIFNIIKSNNKN